MSDFADKASERQAELEADALAMRKPEGPKATGYCLACGEALGGTLWHRIHSRTPRWCNAQCRDDWERKNS